MTCHDFEQHWHAALDARGDVPPAHPPAWMEHLSTCARCRAKDRRYTILGKALRIRPAPAEVTPLHTERLVRALEAAWRPAPRQGRRAPSLRRAAALWMSGAAAASLALFVTLRLASGPAAQRPAPARSAPRAAFAELVADATDATIDLARTTSTPAARLGRTLFVARREAAPESAAPAAPSAPGRLIRRLGGRVQSTVRPLSNGAIRLIDDLLPSGQPRDPDTQRGA